MTRQEYGQITSCGLGWSLNFLGLTKKKKLFQSQIRPRLLKSLNNSNSRVPQEKEVSYHFHCDEELTIAENDGGEGNSKAEGEEEHHIGFVVVLVVGGVPVGSTGALQTFWDISGRSSSLRLYCKDFD